MYYAWVRNSVKEQYLWGKMYKNSKFTRYEGLEKRLKWQLLAQVPTWTASVSLTITWNKTGLKKAVGATWQLHMAKVLESWEGTKFGT